MSSPYKCSIDTIKDFADKYNYQIEIIDSFRERKISSIWIEDFEEFSKKQWNDFSYKLSDGECLKEVQERNITELKKVLLKYENKNIIIGSHGTALSTIINYFKPDFGYDNFKKVKNLMPWIVHFSFDKSECVSIKEYRIYGDEFQFKK